MHRISRYLLPKTKRTGLTDELIEMVAEADQADKLVGYMS